MNWKTIMTLVIVAPFVALLGGIGILAYNISQSWDARNTDALISGLIASCSIGGIVMAGILGAIVGIPLAMRLMDRWREAEPLPPQHWKELPSPARQLPYYGEPPQLADKQIGSYQSMEQYDLWEEENDVTPGEWQ